MTDVNTKNPIKKWGPIIALALPIASVINFIFPSIARSLFSKMIKRAEGFNGRFKHLSISFFSAEVHFSDFLLYESDALNNTENALISVKEMGIKLNRAALRKGEIKAQINIDTPFIEIIKEGILAKQSAQFSGLPLDIPITMEIITLTSGKVQYKDNTTTPQVNFCTDRIDIMATGLSTFNELHTSLPGYIEMKGAAYDGYYKLNVKTDLAIMPPIFDANAEVRLVSMPKLNDLFQAYGGFDIYKGNFSVFVEAASADGRFKGYVKPVIENLQIAGPQDEHTGFWHIAKEKLMSIAANLIENEKHEQIATKLSFEGTYKQPHIHIAAAIVEVLRNAFVCALKPKIDNEISLEGTENI